MPKLIQEVLYFIYTAADYWFSMQYSLVGARFSVLSTLPLGLTHPPIPLVPPTPILHQGTRKLEAIPLFPLCQVIA